MLSSKHKQMLKEAVGETRDAVTEQIKKARPELFHIETGANETLSTRTFHHEPASALPMKGFACAREKVLEAANAK